MVVPPPAPEGPEPGRARAAPGLGGPRHPSDGEVARLTRRTWRRRTRGREGHRVLLQSGGALAHRPRSEPPDRAAGHLDATVAPRGEIHPAKVAAVPVGAPGRRALPPSIAKLIRWHPAHARRLRLLAAGCVAHLADPAVGVGAHGGVPGHVRAPPRRVGAGVGSGGSERARRSLGRRSRTQPARGQRPRAPQAARRRHPGGPRLRARRGAGAVAPRARAGGRAEQEHRGPRGPLVRGGRQPPRRASVLAHAAGLRARGGRAGDGQPGGRRGHGQPLRPHRAAQPPAAGAHGDVDRRLHRARRLRARRARVAGAPRAARAGRGHGHAARPAAAAAAGRHRSPVLEPRAARPAGAAPARPGAAHPREPPPRSPALRHRPARSPRARRDRARGARPPGAAALRHAVDRHRAIAVHADLAGPGAARAPRRARARRRLGRPARAVGGAPRRRAAARQDPPAGPAQRTAGASLGADGRGPGAGGQGAALRGAAAAPAAPSRRQGPRRRRPAVRRAAASRPARRGALHHEPAGHPPAARERRGARVSPAGVAAAAASRAAHRARPGGPRRGPRGPRRAARGSARARRRLARRGARARARSSRSLRSPLPAAETKLTVGQRAAGPAKAGEPRPAGEASVGARGRRRRARRPGPRGRRRSSSSTSSPRRCRACAANPPSSRS